MERSASDIVKSLAFKQELLDAEAEGAIPSLTATDYKLQLYKDEQFQKQLKRGRETRRVQKLEEKLKEHGQQEEQHTGTLEQQQQRGSVGETERTNHEDVRDTVTESEDAVRAANPATQLPERGGHQRSKNSSRRAATGFQE